MSKETFLKVDEQSISLSKAMSHLQSCGKLGSFVGEILRQYILEKELEKIAVISPEVEQAVNNYRQEQQLLEPEKFKQWLAEQNMDEGAFFQQIGESIKLQKLIAQVSEPKLPEYFIEQKLFLDRVVLSRLIVEDQELAEELKSQITEEGESFERLAQEYSLTEDRFFNGMMGAISRGKLPDNLRAAIDTASAGEIVGPMEINNHYCLFRLEKILPASLGDAQLKERLRKKIFEDWLTAKMQKLEIEMNLIN